MKQVLIGFKVADFGGFWEGLYGFCTMGVCKFATTTQQVVFFGYECFLIR